jgi:hypothetical protein
VTATAATTDVILEAFTGQPPQNSDEYAVMVSKEMRRSCASWMRLHASMMGQRDYEQHCHG